ncbi:cytochrome b/b6 domain-containing protein [Phenylobacterium soli]|uniref:Ni/Fe-hydrogenase 1 b-type cytochrome subunit n=1 Tax=Phenylobacterium soli TaxID=2170551 RepID=A0A328AQR0_9CAUL|nr:cytochrome b/b6 domain-containing protein [Phenylobacterium soli]RAK55844.1 Ni/Fe-hydrogenase 1 b-type cytochrome subunit [Phenylobacterium soli]
MANTETAEARRSSRLWDGPTRLVHWALVILIAFAWWSAEEGKMDWHRLAGYAVVGLLVFRLIWGFAGSTSARFASFVKGPAATLAYLKTLPSRARSDMPGHNPLGAWSVLAILATLIAQVVTGLFAVDVDAIEAGPLSDRVDFDTGRLFAKWHHWSFWALETLVVLHLAAIAFYLVYKRANLVRPMVTGRQAFSQDPRLSFAPLWRAALAAVVAAAVAWWVSRGLRL